MSRTVVDIEKFDPPKPGGFVVVRTVNDQAVDDKTAQAISERIGCVVLTAPVDVIGEIVYVDDRVVPFLRALVKEHELGGESARALEEAANMIESGEFMSYGGG